MTFFNVLTPMIYWVLIGLWIFILTFYIKRLCTDLTKGHLLYTLLIILAIDAFRTLFESVYFGAWFTSLAGLLPIEIHSLLVRPEMVFIPKILNVIAALAIISILLLKWLPQESQEKGRLEQLVEARTNELKTEIENRKQIEQDVMAHNEKLRIIFNSTPNILVLVNEDGRVENINHKGVEFSGKLKQSLLGSPGGEIFNCVNYFDGEGCGFNPDCSKCPIRTRILDTFETGKSHTEKEGQMTFLIHGIETAMDLLISTSLLDINGANNVLLSLTDITERKQAEKALALEGGFVDAVFNSIPGLLYLYDMDGKLIRWNKKHEIMTGYSSEELANMNLLDWCKGDTEIQKKVTQSLGKMMETGFAELEINLQKKDGGIIPVYCTAAPLTINGKQYFTGIGLDISERKQNEDKIKKMTAQLLQAHKMEAIGTLAGGIAHDFNNILFPIVGYSQMLLEDVPEDSPLRDSLDGIFTGSMRARELVQQILTFSRQGNGELQLMKMQPIIKEALKLIRSSIPKNIEIKHRLQTDCGPIKADPTHIHQILMNLTTNAYHAMEATGGKMRVKVQEVALEGNEWAGITLQSGNYALLSISDTGCGIPQSHMDKIFEPYFTTKGKNKGTGLGLSIIYGMVKEYKGDIHVHSEMGVGTTFNIYLPLIKHVPSPADKDIKKIIPTGTERILLVDDEIPIMGLQKQMLERLGYAVTERSSSLEALRVFKSNSDAFDLVITDMSMPNMTGDTLAKELTALKPDIPIIICTGFSEGIDEQTAKEIGIRGFLMKPVIQYEMAIMVRSVLDELKDP